MWGLLIFFGTRILAIVFEMAMPSAVAQAVLAEYGVGRLGVAWSDPKAKVPSGRDKERVGGDRVTLEQVKAARRALGKKTTRTKEGPRAAAVRKALGKRKTLAALKVTVDEKHATFTRVPLDELASLARALGTVKLPPAPAS